jgi:peptidoglycan/xylan/chitin deacetylase (PgdA/CDA1 family)
MPLGQFTVTIDGAQIGGGEEKTAKLTVTANVGTLNFPDADQFRFPRQKAVNISLPYVLTLDTDTTDGDSENIGYTVLLTTNHGGRVETSFAARQAGSTINLADVTDVEFVPIPGSTNDAVITAVLGDETSDARAELSATIAAQTDTARVAAYQRSPTPPTRANVKTMIGAHYSGHGWTAMANAASSNMNDTADFLLGTQSAKVVTNTTSVDTGFKSPAIASANFTGCDVRLWLKFDDYAKLGKVSVFLYSSGTDFKSAVNAIDLTAGTEPPAMVKAGNWFAFDVPYSRFTGSGGTFNVAAVTEIRVYVSGKSGQGATVNFGGAAAIYQDEFAKWPNGVLTISMDDCWDGQTNYAVPYLDRFGERATFFPIANFTDVNRFSTARLQQLRDQGHEVGAHAGSLATHGTGWNAMTNAELVTELEALKQWQVDNGYSSNSLAYPLGNWNPTVAATVARYYESARLAEGGFHVNARPVNPYALRCYDAGTLTQAVIKTEMDRAKASKGWLILMYHQIVAAGATGNQATTAEFQEIVDYAHTLGMPIRTQGEVIKAAQG